MRREAGAIWGQGDTLFAARVLASAAVMGAALLAWAGIFQRLVDLGREGPRIVRVMTGLALGVGIYAALLHALRVEGERVVIGRLLRLRAGREGNEESQGETR